VHLADGAVAQRVQGARQLAALRETQVGGLDELGRRALERVEALPQPAHGPHPLPLVGDAAQQVLERFDLDARQAVRLGTGPDDAGPRLGGVVQRGDHRARVVAEPGQAAVTVPAAIAARVGTVRAGHPAGRREGVMA
jgi:hypothetical protein